MPLYMWNDWLPEPLATQVRTEEPKRFLALINALEARWKEDKATKSMLDAATATLPYVPLVKAMLHAKADPGSAALQRLAELLLDIILSTDGDLAPQARWGALLHLLLRLHRRKMAPFVVPWRPLYLILRQQLFEPSLEYEGAGVGEARRSSLVRVVHRARRYFPPGSAAEIWAEFGPILRDPTDPACFEALGWLTMFMPTQAALCRDGDWRRWAAEWMALWGTITHNTYWQSLWMGLFARLAKHDVHGVVAWDSIFQEMCSRFMWAFEVPVGTATAVPPYGGGAPALCQAVFADDLGSRSAAAAQAIIYLVGRRSTDSSRAAGTKSVFSEPTSPDDEDPVVLAIESITALLEQYYHPSNGGKWTGSLSLFMRMMASHLCKRMVAEHYAARSARELASRLKKELQNGDAAEQEEDEGVDVEDDGSEGLNDSEASDSESDEELNDDDSASDDEYAIEPEAGEAPMESGLMGASQANARRHLTQGTIHRIVAALVRLASKGQASKDKHMRRYASIVLSQLAHVAPSVVLPAVHRHFVTALETVTAARQYGNAIQTLSLCVRPLLLAGLQHTDSLGVLPLGEGAEAATGSVEARTAAAHSVASALVATLPGIDANDPPKSLAVFRLYCCVLSSIGALPEYPGQRPGALPMYAGEWADELLSRVFAVISNLDSPDVSGTGEGLGQESGMGSTEEASFLMEGSSMFRPLMELLYVRLPPASRTAAIRRTCAFLLDNTFTSVTAEAAVLCNAVAWADSITASELLVAPLLKSLARDAASLTQATDAASSASRLSRVTETSLKWRLSLLSSALYHLGDAIVAHGATLRGVLSALAAAPSQAVQEAAARVASSTLVGLLSYYPLDQYVPVQPQKSTTMECAAKGDAGDEEGSVALEPFLDKWGNSGEECGVSSPGAGISWHISTKEEIALAEQLVEDFLTAPAKLLLEVCGGSGTVPSKDLLRGALLQLEGGLSGARSCLPDFPGCGDQSLAPASVGETEERNVALFGQSGAKVGSPDLRSLVSDAMVAAFRVIAPSDVDTLALCVRVADLTLAVGTAEHSDSEACVDAWLSDDRWMAEPAVAGRLISLSSENIDAETTSWHRRRPRWVAVEKVSMNLLWRTSQAMYRWYASTTRPVLPIDALPTQYMALLSQVVHFAVRGPKGVRESAVAVAEGVMKRYPALSPAVLAPVVAAIAKAEDALEFDPKKTTAVLIPRLVTAVRQAAQVAASADEPESEMDQSMAIGATSLFTGTAIWRHVTRDWAGLTALCLGLMASAAHTGTDAQLALTLGTMMLAFRYIRPPSDSPQDHQLAKLLFEEALAQAAAYGKAPSPQAHVLPWRYVAAANVYPLYFLPVLDADMAGKLMRHYINVLLMSDIPVARHLAIAGINMMLLPLWKSSSQSSFSQKSSSLSGCKEQATEEKGQGKGWMTQDALDAARAALLEALTSGPSADSFVSRLFVQLTHGHPELANVGVDSAMQLRGGGLHSISRDDAVARTVAATLVGGAEWPGGRARVSAVSARHFIPLHARLVQIASTIAPTQMLRMLRDPIQAALSGAQDSDRSRTAVAAEALSGLIASGAAHSTGDQAEWTHWVAPTIGRALASAPLDLVELWEAALRFAVHELATSGSKDQALEALLDATVHRYVAPGPQHAESLSAPPVAGSEASAAVYKRVSYLGEVLAELSSIAGAGIGSSAALRSVLARGLDELPQLLTAAPGELVRKAVAGLAADLTMALLEPAYSAMAIQEAITKSSYNSEYLSADDSNGNGALGKNGNASGSEAAVAGVPADLLGDDSNDEMVLVLGTSHRRLKQKAKEFLNTVVSNFIAATAALYERARASSSPLGGGKVRGDGLHAIMEVDDEAVMGAADAAMEEETSLELAGEEPAFVEVEVDDDKIGAGVLASHERNRNLESIPGEHDRDSVAVSTVAFSVELIVQLLASNTSAASPYVIAMLPSLLRVQELLPSELQFVGLVARKALVTAKYQPLGEGKAGEVLRVLHAATNHGELWPERAAALAFTQYFWFRHAMVLGRTGTTEVVEMALERLQDEKQEMRELAATTLSGVVRGLPDRAAAALRTRLLSRVSEVFKNGGTSKKKRARTAIAVENEKITTQATEGMVYRMPARHGAALALQALVVSSPYDVPAWLPDVLMVMVGLASEPAPVKSTITKALGEFRRTHEESGLVEVKDALTTEQWEAIRDVASPASYFV